MIKKVEMETCICDNCGVDIADLDGQYSAFGSEYLKQVMEDSDWIEKDGNHYCFYCYGYDDNDEIFIVKERENKPKFV